MEDGIPANARFEDVIIAIFSVEATSLFSILFELSTADYFVDIDSRDPSCREAGVCTGSAPNNTIFVGYMRVNTT
uniref:Uncharacterized protein n=1 Tax=Oryza brachyantha TaxID=4533 RepID=J3MD85_ORYBR